MVRAAELLRPSIVLIENVPAVMKDRYQGQNVVNMARNRLQDLDYRVHDAVVSMDGLGVAQTRKRHILLATTEGWAAPQDVFSALKIMDNTHDLRWAIGDLENVQPVGFDSPPSAKQINLDRMKYLLDNDVYDLPNDLRPVCHQDDHSYKSMYGRLRWDKPAQTITSGFGSIGQGRYMHPSRMSALTPHEAARLQGFPDYFDFSAVGTRTGLATMIGNAVPPQLGASIFEALLRSLRDTGVAASDDIPLAWSA
jgi:DNA (cytosine-5)-methyltransferase 1